MAKSDINAQCAGFSMPPESRRFAPLSMEFL